MRSLLALLLLASQAFAQTNSTQWPVHDTGLTDRIQWDHYSMMVDGRRMFMWSGELHYWRLPVPELWRDILEKVKAAGFNAISVYSHWGYHSANNQTLDFETGARDFTPILDIAKELGLFVTMRGGPYVNAETNAGGFALWTTTGAYGSLRNNDPRYTAAWTPFMTEIHKIVEKYQYTNDGPIILNQLENEIAGQRTSSGAIYAPIADYMVALEKNARDNGVVIPLMTNAPNMNSKSWSKDYLPGPGAQDIYSLDSYPSCWSCNLAECGSGSGATNYAQHFDVVSPTQPSFMAEFQGGSYNPWGGPEGGCPANHGPSFVSVYYRHLVAERITLINLYMLFGGTNWGTLATNVVATSYDYSAPIQETRQIAEKYYETKLVGFFLRAAHDLTMTDRKPFSTSYVTTANVGATELRNPKTGAGFYILRHSDLKTNAKLDTRMKVTTSKGDLTIPAHAAPIKLNGQQSKVIVTDFHFGNNTLLYSTSEVLSHSVVNGRSILALWLYEGEAGEFSILGGSKRREVVSGTGGGVHQDGDNLVLSYTQQKTQGVLRFDNFDVVLVPHQVAYRFWAPTLTNDPIVEPENVLFVFGPYLVRSAHISGTIVSVTGDLDGPTTLEIFAPSAVKTITWNGKAVSTQKTSYGSLKVSLQQPGVTVESLQASLSLSGWKYSEALPEASAEYDDTKWTVADHTTTPNPTKPSTLPVLYADDYGYHSGVILFRGHFSGDATAARLTVQGGTAFGWSAWLNSAFLGSFPGDADAAVGNLILSFANTTLNSGGDNVLTVVMDHSGHNQRAEAVYPRGILSATLETTSNTTFSKWTVAGNAGGERNIDPVRGPLAEGGLHAERLGWHLPGFDDSAWTSRSPAEGVTNATVAFFRTTKDLDLPAGYDAAFAFKLSAPVDTPIRVQLYVNGYQYGKFVPHIGHQTSFPVPPGIINVRGSNTIGLNVWSQTPAGGKVDVALTALGVYSSSFDPAFDAEHLQPEWTSEREEYA